MRKRSIRSSAISISSSSMATRPSPGSTRHFRPRDRSQTGSSIPALWPAMCRSRHRNGLTSSSRQAAARSVDASSIARSRRLDLHPARWCIIGRALDSDIAARPDVMCHEFRADFPALLARADVSVSHAGYNTVCDILRAGPRSVLVPFAAGGETEQTERAARLAARGCALVLAEQDLTPERLAAAIKTAPCARASWARSRRCPRNCAGAARTARAQARPMSMKRV